MHLEGVTIERNISYFRRVLLFNHVNVKNTFQGGTNCYSICMMYIEGKKDLVVDQLFAALVFSLGLDRALGMRHPTKPINSVEFQIYRNREPNGDEFIDSEPKKKKKSLRQKRSPTIRVVSGQVAEGFIEIREHLDRCFTSSNHLEFGHLFSDSNQQLPLKLEICSGFGEWVVKQVTFWIYRLYFLRRKQISGEQIGLH